MTALAFVSGRCLPCESAVTKVIHPVNHGYLGKADNDFADCLEDVYRARKGDGNNVFESGCVYFDKYGDEKLLDQIESLDYGDLLHSD